MVRFGEAQGCSRRDSVARARKRGERIQRERATSIACTSVRAHTYVHARVSERDGVSGCGKGVARRKRKKGKDPRIRVCARAGDIERNLKKKEKRDERDRGRGEKRERERGGGRNLRLWCMCVTYVRAYAKMREAGEERDEESSA